MTEGGGTEVGEVAEVGGVGRWGGWGRVSWCTVGLFDHLTLYKHSPWRQTSVSKGGEGHILMLWRPWQRVELGWCCSTTGHWQVCGLS